MHTRPLLQLLGLLFVFAVAAPTASGQEVVPENIKIRWERQISYLESLVNKEPGVPLHYMRIAQAYARLGGEGEVLRFTQEAVRLGGNRLAADLLLADFYSEQEQFGEALSLYLQVLKTSPRQTHALTQAWLLMQRARLVQMDLPINRADLERRLNEHGFYIDPRITRQDSAGSKEKVKEGNQYLNVANARGAIQSYQLAASFDPWNADAYRGLGVSHARDGDFARALGAYHLFIALAPPGDKDVPKVRQIILDFYRNGK